MGINLASWSLSKRVRVRLPVLLPGTACQKGWNMNPHLTLPKQWNPEFKFCYISMNLEFNCSKTVGSLLELALCP